MAKQTINTGSANLAGDGESIRDAFIKINENFDEVYTLSESTVTLVEDYNFDTNSRIDGLVIPSDISDLTDTQGLLNVDLTGYATVDQIPADVSDLTDTQGLLNGGGAGNVQPYLELTNIPFVTQAVVLGEPVTITAAPAGTSALLQVDILQDSVFGGLTIIQPGTGYSVNQKYKIFYWQIGGGDFNSDLTITIDSVDENGGILTVSNPQFTGLNNNAPGSYGNLSIDYEPSVFDNIDTGVTLTRDINQGLFNIDAETEYDNNTYLSPLGTAWNSDGWGSLVGINSRSYTTFRTALNNQVGNNILNSELVMHDTINDKYYKFDFTQWGGNNGGFSYTRTEVTDPNYFEKTNYGDQVDVFVPETSPGSGIGITRGNNNSIYNPFREEGYNQSTSPAGTLWNTEGWDDLSNITTRTYSSFYNAFGGNLGNRVPGSKTIMYIPETGKYYAVEWLTWTQNGNGGGFSYTRREIDLTKINEGVKFADGTVLKSAAGVGRVKSTAIGSRKIEEVSGYKEVSVTQRSTNTLTTVTSRAATGFNSDIWIDTTQTTIDDIIDNPQSYGNATNFEFSLDNLNWYPYNFSYSSDGTERGIGVSSPTWNYAQGDTVYFRYTTGGAPVVWWNSAELPSGSGNFRGAVIDYHAYSGEATWIGTIHIVDDSGEEHISHTEVSSGSTDSENDDLWLVQNEGTISYRRIDGESKTLKVHWTAKVFYGSEFWD